jgi:acyl-CoA synthetase (AMP-forming)/AMP-acid ligase II
VDATLPRLNAILADARPAAVLTTTAIQSVAEPVLREAPQKLCWLATDQPDDRADHWRHPAVTGGTLAFLQYTSGSTASPKGVMVSHANLLHNSALIHRNFKNSPDSRGVIWLPPYHDMGLIGGILQPLYGGFPVSLMSPIEFLLKPRRWLEAISRMRATISGGPNFAYDLCVRKIPPEQRASLDLSHWKLAFNGAEAVRHETLERFTAAFAPHGFRRAAFYPCYGLAEATLLVAGPRDSAAPVVHAVQRSPLEHKRAVAASIDDRDAWNLVSCGRASPDQRLAIVDPETHLRSPPGHIGEIWVSGPSVARGYWQQPEQTERSFGARLADTGEGPFLRTGDMGFMHDGELYITGRHKDLISVGGRKHYSEDVEQTVEKSHPWIKPSCCAAFSIDVAGEERLVVAAEVDRSCRFSVRDQYPEMIRSVRQAV